MPPKRKSTGPTAKSTQSTLAFHGSTNKVTKPGTRASNAKKNLLEEPTSKDEKPDVVEVQVKDQEEEPTNAEAAIIEQTKQVQQETESTPQEVEARQITKQTLEAWLKKQDAGNAPRVHQEDLSLHEKILRKFDMSGQYGPCTGIARLKRWQRAHRLGLEPPIEVLAVLLKEQDGKDKLTVQKSQIDELLNSRAETEE